MSNLFKEILKLLNLKVEDNHSPLEFKLTKKTKLDDKLIGKYGVLGYEKF